MKILTLKKQRQIAATLADIAEAFVKCCACVPYEVLSQAGDTIMEGLADVANDVGGIWAMEAVGVRIHEQCIEEEKDNAQDT